VGSILDLDFTAEQKAFRQRVREWLRLNAPKDRRPSGAGATDFDVAWQRKQYDAGWAGVAWPKEYGGLGLSAIEQLIWYEEYARADAPPVGNLFIGLHHGGPTLIACGSGAQKSFHLPKILKGEAIWCQGFSEPGSGSDLASLRTRGRVDGDCMVVNGQKIWTSYAQHAQYQELLIRTDPDSRKHRGLTWIIGDMRLPGVEVRPIRTMSGDYHFNEVFYDEVRIPLSNVVGEINEGWKVAMATLGFERGTALIAHQINLERTVERLIRLARDNRTQDGTRRMIDDEVFASRLATARAEVAAMRAMTYASVSRGIRQSVPGPEGTFISLYQGELEKRVQALAVSMVGPNGVDADSEDWIYKYLESFKWTIAGGTSEIRRNIIGERILGLPRLR